MGISACLGLLSLWACGTLIKAVRVCRHVKLEHKHLSGPEEATSKNSCFKKGVQTVHFGLFTSPYSLPW